MTIYQFESGHGVGARSIGRVTPLFSVRSTRTLHVEAGAESVDAPEPSIMLETALTVEVAWRLHGPDHVHAVAEPAPRRGGRGRNAAPVEEPGLLVGLRSVVVHSESVPLLESAGYAAIAEYVDPKKPNSDYQAFVHQFCAGIADIHHKVREKAAAGIPDIDDPTSEPVDYEGMLAARVRRLGEVLDQVGTTGVFDEGDEGTVVEGVFDLRNVLADAGAMVEEDVITELLALPIRQMAPSIEDELPPGFAASLGYDAAADYDGGADPDAPVADGAEPPQRVAS